MNPVGTARCLVTKPGIKLKVAYHQADTRQTPSINPAPCPIFHP
jgi:hypothetical protein